MAVQSISHDPASKILDYAGGNRSDDTALLSPKRGGDVLACGFGMTVAAWIAAYLTRLPMWAAPAPGQVTVSLMLAMVFLGGILAGRYSGFRAAVLAGVLSGILDILVVGSVLHDMARGSAPDAGLWMAGSVLLNAVIAALGGALGTLFPSPNRASIRWAPVMALVLAAATLPLITAGGLVTGLGVGMAVPDWPQSYGYNMFLFPLSKMQSAQGNFYEHSHRLMGALVGLTTLATAIYITLVDRRRWVIGFSWIIFAAVCIQGILGGFRVTENSIPLATAHGIFAQIVFASMACLTTFLVRPFIAPPPRVLTTPMELPADLPAPRASSDAPFAAALVICMLIQLTLGALVRQRVESLVLVHIMMAAGVALLAIACGFRALVLHAGFRPLRLAGSAVMAVVGIQLVLGVVALALRPGTVDGHVAARTNLSALWTTIHQVNGALLLACCALLWVWALRDARRPVAPAA